MKAVILAGGHGTRISEESDRIPKPMIEIGGHPILWHIMKMYSAHGINDFVICLGYKGYVIKEYFSNYYLHNSDVSFDLKNNQVKTLSNNTEPWKVTLVSTGENTLTGGRLKRVRDYVKDEDFCMTYGDGVSDINITELVRFHKDHKRLSTVTAIRPPGRFGVLEIDSKQSVNQVREKPESMGALINGGFFVLNPKALDTVDGDQTSWEQEPMSRLASQGQMMAFEHKGFWQPMDTLREKRLLEDLWSKGKAPWKKW